MALIFIGFGILALSLLVHYRIKYYEAKDRKKALLGYISGLEQRIVDLENCFDWKKVAKTNEYYYTVRNYHPKYQETYLERIGTLKKGSLPKGKSKPLHK